MDELLEHRLRLMSDIHHEEAVRQLTVCNACRYCEGYCNAFQALTRHRSFDKPTVSHLANLCHNCRGCYYACQYTEPHEFAINIPALLANIRAQNWEQHIRPQWLSRTMQASAWPYVLLVLVFAVLFSLIVTDGLASSVPFYSAISHKMMVTIFTPLFILPWIAVYFGLCSYWKSIGGARLTVSDIRYSFSSAARMKQLSGGQGQGCNYESEEQYTQLRRWAHQATMYGFLLCFASTTLGTVYHYVFDWIAPYPLFSLPKLFGVIGGLLLSVGTAALFLLKRQSDRALGSEKRTAGEYAFIVMLFMVSTTGLLLYASGGTAMASAWLVIHLAFIATFFITLPYSKMVHGFFRLAALCREAQLQRR